MSKAEILQELPKLKREERQEVLDQLWQIEEQDLLQGGGEPTAEEKALLDQALEEYQRNPNAGRPWREAMDSLERKAKP
ncbi:MAG: hypothetical protein NTY01_04345 [Verrucomicrobia bacterium]|nr:hypothetical protein [Verrucomicrobiota bacterium]